jgi:exodeoxyribonuclease V beta subunit
MVFDSKTVLLEGSNLIEASAGTGKTYTLAELYIRFVLEQDLTVDQILVVTYTRAATEELRDRLRQRLVEQRDHVLNNPEPHRAQLNTLTLAIQSFDQAAIYTIHGFCQRVLADFAFESGLRFDVDLISDEREILQAATDDFWRKHLNQAGADFTRYLIAKKQTPEVLLQSVRSLIGKPYLNYQALPDIDFERFQVLVSQCFNDVKAIWQAEQEQIIATLKNKALLNGNKYRVSSVEKWLINLAALVMIDTMPTSLPEGFEKFTLGKLEEGLKKGQILPELRFWTATERLLEAQQQLETARTIQLQQLRMALLEHLKTAVPELKQQQQVQSFDDLLVTLEQALNAPQGDALVDTLRGQYKAALIDEFQDTDPVQYQSFRRIYAQSGLPTFYVGDPKQAIYSFRGADIFTYLKAKEATQAQHTLMTNWRSHPQLVSAINQVFEQTEQPFIYHQIPFIPVGSGRDDSPALLIDDDQQTPLSFFWAHSDKPLTKAEMTQRSAQLTADEIARLLNQAHAGQAQIIKDDKQQPLAGGDIAVLVRNHRQANEIQGCLQQRGINSVQQGRENVFASHEALLMERLLLAVAEPNNSGRIITVLASSFFELTAVELYQVQQDEPTWLNYLDVFHELHQKWLEKGFMSMFRHLMMTQSVQQRILATLKGERQLTNLYHLAELIQDYCSRQKNAMDAVLYWLSSHRQSSEEEETAQLRLESDEQLVKIITIHKSKGLEYPIVFCPFLWDVNLRSANDPILRFHDEDNDNAAHVALLDPDLTKAKASVLQEEKAEDLRLLYVALTRARERCVICWGNVKGVADSALFSLLHPNLASSDADSMQADIGSLIENSSGTMSYQPLVEQESVMLIQHDTQDVTLEARTFTGHIERPWRIGSFSALTSGHDAELPDYDASTVTVELTPVTVIDSKPNVADRFQFPKGAQAGTCLHSIFELWDFNTDDREGLTLLVEKILLQYGFEPTWTDSVCDWLCEVVNTPLSERDSFSLSALKPSQRLDEMAFYFPVSQLSVNSLKRQLLPHLSSNSPLALVLNQLHFFDLTGFMKGFIDLIYEHEGRFYVVDYKSNYLGDQPENYSEQPINQAMISHHYPMQYLIYTLALHRYLRLRIADYDPEQHLGGVYYLFIRGMHPDWQQAGVYSDRPSSELITAFDAYLQGIEHAQELAHD